MKKNLLFSLAATALLAGCSGDEVVDMADSLKPQAISFENPFVDKATKADLTTEGMSKFYVYGKHNGEEGNLFANTTVTKQINGSWTYDVLKYWKDGNYIFTAYSDGNESFTTPTFDDATGHLTFTDYLTTGAKDLILSEIVKANGVTATAGKEIVQFTFHHILSKVKFTFTNGFSNGTMTIKDLTFNTNTKGTYSSKTEKWTDLKENGTFSFIDGSGKEIKTETPSNALYVIPTANFENAAAIDVSFKVSITGSNQIQSDITDKTFKVTLPLKSWEKNIYYNYTATITPENMGAKPIVFGVSSVEGWTEQNGPVTPAHVK